ncbi:MAG: hypothetical protein D3917_13760, partial [Candidatus Electrothrix sp. AX5]|nr:hypothetical protein [Candidatus Electrothrix sp. AX5]
MRKLVSCAVMLVTLHCGFVHALVPMPDPVDIEPIVQKLLAEDGNVNDYFGRPVSIDGDTAVIGAPYSDSNSGSGAVYIFTRSCPDNEWTLQQKITRPIDCSTSLFGYSLSLDGDTVLISAPGGDTYVFTRTGAVWSQQQKLMTSSDVLSIRSVDLDGDSAILGAPDEDDRGAAYVFTRTGTVWVKQQKLTANNGSIGDLLGWSISISGDIAVIGTYKDNNDTGAAYIFTRSGNIWSQEQKLTAGDADEGDRFGIAVSVDGDTALIGAEYDDNKGNSFGAAYIFTHSGSIWSQQQKLLPDDGEGSDRFGAHVSIDNGVAVIGSPNDDDNGNLSGATYIFTRSGNIWSQQQKLLPTDVEAGDVFGSSVDIDGDTVLIGAIFADNKAENSGAAYIYSLTAADCNTDPLATGMTWGVNRYNSDLDISRVHCYGQIGPNRGPCNPYKGDTLCSVPLPVLCLKVDGLSRPPYELAHCPSCAMNDEYYNGWSEGTAKLTDPVPGNTFTSLSDANAYCAAQLGDGYRVAEHHDGRWVSGMDESHFYDGTWPLTTSSGGWGFYVPGQVPDDSRFWVHINDQNANCWDKSGNTAPLADAGANQSVVEGEEVCFDGSGSSDADNDELSYSWSLTGWPVSSSAVLDNPTVDKPCMTADLPGSYEVSLVVNDGTVDSAPSIAEAVAVSYLNAVTETLLEAGKAINGLDPAVFKNKKRQKKLSRMINRSLELADKGKYLRALKMLRKDVLKRLDGCP